MSFSFAKCSLGVLVLAGGCVTSACGNDLSCGEGTVQKGGKCVVKQTVVADAGTGGASNDGGGGGAGAGVGGAGGTTSGGGAAGTGAPPDSGPPDTILFDGITAAAPADGPGVGGSPDSILVTWQPASYPTHPKATIHYEIYAATSAGNETFGTPTAVAPPGSTSFLVQNLDAAKTYFVVRAVPSEGAAKDVNTVEMFATPQTDGEKPTFGGAANATPDTSTSVLVSWSPATDDLTPPAAIVYRVYWSAAAAGPFSLGVVTDPGATSAIVKGLPAADKPFYFSVTAVDAAGNTDDNNNVISGSTAKDTEPPVFAGCRAALDPTASGALVTWDPATDDTTTAANMQYDVYAFEVPVTKDTTFTTPVGTFTGVTQGQITGLLPGTHYRVVCRASDEAKNQEDNRVTVAFDTGTDSQPPTFAGIDDSVTIIDTTSVTLGWSPATDDQTPQAQLRYNVYGSNTPGNENFSLPIATSAPGLTFDQLKQTELAKVLPPGDGSPVKVSNQDYYFVVRAVDQAGNEDSNTKEVHVTTLVSFEQDVQPIFTQNCALSTCHSVDNPNPPQGQVLSDGYAHSSIVGVQSREVPSLLRVSTDGVEEHSYLWIKITAGPGLVNSQMPPVAANRVLTQEQINTIGAWILQGAKDN